MQVAMASASCLTVPNIVAGINRGLAGRGRINADDHDFLRALPLLKPVGRKRGNGA
jgi:hypothetical protein